MLNIQNEYFHLSVDLARSHLTPREKDVVAAYYREGDR